jgi:hypothetical protein
MKIAIEHIKQWQEWRALWNNTPLEEIEFTLNGEVIDLDVTEQILDAQGHVTKSQTLSPEEFKYTGLANIDYLLMAVESLEVDGTLTIPPIGGVLQELGVNNLDETLEEIIKLRLGYQPWRDRRTELLTQPVLTDADRQELADIESKLMPVGWRATLGRSHGDVQAMEIIRKAAKLIPNTDSLVKGLESLKLPHHVCEDAWYSCPKSCNCCNDSANPNACNCGADKHNQKVDDLILLVKGRKA